MANSPEMWVFFQPNRSLRQYPILSDRQWNTVQWCHIRVRNRDRQCKPEQSFWNYSNYYLSNVIKGTFVKTSNELVTYGDNWNGGTPTDIVTIPEIGNFYEVWLTSTQLNERAWTTLNGSVNIPVAGTYHIEGYFSTSANVDNNYGSVRITNTLPRTSFQYTINENSARVVYAPIDVTLKLDANTALTLDVWSGKVTTGEGWIRATRIG